MLQLQLQPVTLWRGCSCGRANGCHAAAVAARI